MPTPAPAAVTESHLLEDDGIIPNNPRLPLMIYRRGLLPLGGDPESAILARFTANGWRGAWVDGIFSYHHYHSTAHEALGIARGWARVQFGGPEGVIAEVRAGDAVLIPAGVGHCRLASASLSVVGAYPKGQEWDLCRAAGAERGRALRNIPAVPLPETDPLFGEEGPVYDLWLSRVHGSQK